MNGHDRREAGMLLLMLVQNAVAVSKVGQLGA